MTDQGRIDTYRLRVNTACQLYAIYRRELLSAIMDIKSIGDECRALYIEIDTIVAAVSDENTKNDLRDLLLHMQETRMDDKILLRGVEKNWVKEIVSEVLDELHELRKTPPKLTVMNEIKNEEIARSA